MLPTLPLARPLLNILRPEPGILGKANDVVKWMITRQGIWGPRSEPLLQRLHDKLMLRLARLLSGNPDGLVKVTW